MDTLITLFQPVVKSVLKHRFILFLTTSYSLNQNQEKLTSVEQNNIRQKTQTFCENYSDESFGDIYTLKSNISSVLDGKSNQNRQTQLAALTDADTDGLHVFSADSDGIICYYVDGFEKTTADDVTPDMLSKEGYRKKEQKNNTRIKSGTPVYKLIKDDDWTLVIPLTKECAKELKDSSSVHVRFPKDNETMTAAFSMKKVKGSYLGYLAFDSSMVRYAQNRFVDVELILEDQSGLKIPKSAITKKDFYVIPEDYLTQGGNSNSTGVLIDTGKENAEFQAVDIYYRDTQTGSVYVNPDDFEKNTTLKKAGSSDTYQLSETKQLKGVYNINRGYAVFRQVADKGVACLLFENSGKVGIGHPQYLADIIQRKFLIRIVAGHILLCPEDKGLG